MISDKLLQANGLTMNDLAMELTPEELAEEAYLQARINAIMLDVLTGGDDV